MGEPLAYRLLESLLAAHQGYYDVSRDYEFAHHVFPGYAELHSHGEGYVLAKRAKLWEADVHEFVFFDVVDRLDRARLEEALAFMRNEAVAKVDPKPDHMTSYLSLVIIACELEEGAAHDFGALLASIRHKCGALSGIHSVIASGTTSKQLDKESQALPIGFGSMLIECMLAILALCAVGFVWSKYAEGGYAAPTQVFADGLSGMLAVIPGLKGVQEIAYALLVLAVSAFCLTSLDTATRLARYLFQEFWIPVGQTADDLVGWRKTLNNKYLATVITVALGIGLGITGYSVIWPLFGAANQLLAALALLAVCVWLGNAGRNNKMLYVPMAFISAATIASLVLAIHQKVLAIGGGGEVLEPAIQLALAIALLVLAIVLIAKGAKTLYKRRA